MKMKFVIGKALAIAIIAVSLSAFAQSAVENQTIIEVVNDPAPAAVTQELPQAQVQTVQAVSAPAQQPAVVLQNQPVIVQKQATTVVEDTPLTESAADKLRRQRIEMEQATESKLVEKLEEARMKAEQERATKLLTGLEEKKEEPKVEEKKAEEVIAVPAVVATPQEPVQVVAPVQPTFQEVVATPTDAPVAPAVGEVKADLAVADVKEETPANRYYITLDTGFVGYDADNIETGVGFGTNLGIIFDERYIVEGNFLFTRADIESVSRTVVFTPTGVYPTIIQMDQYNFGGTFKYRILKTRFAPYVGGSLVYTYRNYQDTQNPGCAYGYDCALEASSWAVDMGLLVGADVRLSERLFLGSEFKYLFNIAYDVNTASGYEQSKLLYPSFYASPVEELGYYSLAISLKYLF